MKVEKRNYSADPWRLIDSNGDEVYIQVQFEHPTLGQTVINGPVCGRTKADVYVMVLQLLEFACKRGEKILGELKEAKAKIAELEAKLAGSAAQTAAIGGDDE